MLVHRRVTPYSMTLVPILYTWVEKNKVKYSFLSKETAQWQGPHVEPSTFRSEIQSANHYITAPPRDSKE